MATRAQPKRAFYTLAELARMTGLGYRTLLKMAQADLIPVARFGAGKMYLVPAAWVDQAVEGTLDHWVEVMRVRGLMPAAEPELTEHGDQS